MKYIAKSSQYNLFESTNNTDMFVDRLNKK